MARVIGEVKPDWSVIRYETKRDFEQLKEQGRIYDLCRELVTLDSENCGIDNSISYFTVRINLDNSSAKIAIKISPDLLDFPGLERVIEKINRRFVDDLWRGFSSYDIMVQNVAKDYNVFPVWRDVERIINR